MFSRPFKIVASKPPEAFIRLLTSDHPFAVELGRRISPPVPRHRRICRFCHCQGAVEDEVHILLECQNDRLLQLREDMLLEGLRLLLPGIGQIYHRLGSMEFLDFVLGKEHLLLGFAQFVQATFEAVKSVSPFFPRSDDELRALHHM